MAEVKNCDYCQKPAEFLVIGWTEDGTGEGPNQNLICSDHKAEFEQWESLFKTDTYLHGYVYYDDIVPLEYLTAEDLE